MLCCKIFVRLVTEKLEPYREIVVVGTNVICCRVRSLLFGVSIEVVVNKISVGTRKVPTLNRLSNFLWTISCGQRKWILGTYVDAVVSSVGMESLDMWLVHICSSLLFLFPSQFMQNIWYIWVQTIHPEAFVCKPG